jgi:hypothetical protein
MAGNRRKTGLVLQDRDRRLFSELTTMRIIDRELTKVAAGFRSTTRANARLLKLTRAGLLNRFFVGSIAAGRKAIYTLSKRGEFLHVPNTARSAAATARRWLETSTSITKCTSTRFTA